MLTDSTAPQTKWTFFSVRWAPCSLECLKQSQLQQDVGCQVQTQSVPSPKMRSSLFLRSHTQAVGNLLKWGASHIDSIAMLHNSKSRLKMPTAPTPSHFLDLPNNGGDNEKIDNCHRPRQPSLSCAIWSQQEEGPFSNPAYAESRCNSAPSSCCGYLPPLGLPGFRKDPWVSYLQELTRFRK